MSDKSIQCPNKWMKSWKMFLSRIIRKTRPVIFDFSSHTETKTPPEITVKVTGWISPKTAGGHRYNSGTRLVMWKETKAWYRNRNSKRFFPSLTNVQFCDSLKTSPFCPLSVFPGRMPHRYLGQISLGQKISITRFTRTKWCYGCSSRITHGYTNA